MVTTTPTKTAAELARHAMEVFARQDLDTLRNEIWHDDIIENFVAVEVMNGKEAVSAFHAEIFAATPDMEFTINRIIGGDEQVAVVEWTLTGTFTGGAFQGIEPTGRQVEIRGLEAMEFKDGLLYRTATYNDLLGFARQVGMLPAEDSTADRALKRGFNALTRLRARTREAIKRPNRDA